MCSHTTCPFYFFGEKKSPNWGASQVGKLMLCPEQKCPTLIPTPPSNTNGISF